MAHEDILPYSTAETNPLHHELFDKFLEYSEGKDPPFVAQDTLRAWQDKNHPWLELSDVHKETTENIRVTVIPFYMGYRENQQVSETRSNRFFLVVKPIRRGWGFKPPKTVLFIKAKEKIGLDISGSTTKNHLFTLCVFLYYTIFGSVTSL